jgi:hypothetical protein
MRCKRALISAPFLLFVCVQIEDEFPENLLSPENQNGTRET